MMRPILLRGGRVIDPSRGIDGVADVLPAGRQGRPRSAATSAPADGAQIDRRHGAGRRARAHRLHVHLREPGHEDVETIATGARRRRPAASPRSARCRTPIRSPTTRRRSASSSARRSGRAGARLSDRRHLGRAEGRAARRVRRDGGRGRGGGERRRQAGDVEPPDAHRARVRADLRHSGRRSLRGPDARRRAARCTKASSPPGSASRASPPRPKRSWWPATSSSRELTGGHVHLCHMTHARIGRADPLGQGAGLKVTAEVTPASLLADRRGAARATTPTRR